MLVAEKYSKRPQWVLENIPRSEIEAWMVFENMRLGHG